VRGFETSVGAGRGRGGAQPGMPHAGAQNASFYMGVVDRAGGIMKMRRWRRREAYHQQRREAYHQPRREAYSWLPKLVRNKKPSFTTQDVATPRNSLIVH